MKRKLVLLLVVAMLFSFVTGCTNNGGNGAVEEEKGTAPENEEVSVPASEENAAESNVEEVEVEEVQAPARTDITVAITAAIPEFDPVNWYLSTQSQIFQNVYSTLVDVVVNDDLEVIARPNLASSWELEEEGKVWVFHLNENAVYSNGEPVTAEHVKTCFEFHKENPYTMHYVSMIDQIEVRDEHTVAFHLFDPWASAPECWYMVAVFNPDLYQADKEAYIMSPVGSGPYELTEIDEAAGTYTMTLKEEWWGDLKPSIETVNVRTITDTTSLVIALETGEIDFVSNVRGADVDILSANPDILLKETISLVGSQLLISSSSKVEALQIKEIRQAIAYAVDYETIANTIYSGHTSSKSSTVQFSTLDAAVPEGVEKYYYDLGKAKELVEASGLETPINLGTLIGGSSNGSAEMVQQYLSLAGFEVEIVQLEGNTLFQSLSTGEYDLAITSYPGYVSAAETIIENYGTGHIYNFSHFSNERVDELGAIMMTTLDSQVYLDSLKEALEIVVEECTTVCLGIPASYSAGVKGLSFDPAWAGLDLMTAHW